MGKSRLWDFKPRKSFKILTTDQNLKLHRTFWVRRKSASSWLRPKRRTRTSDAEMTSTTLTSSNGSFGMTSSGRAGCLSRAKSDRLWGVEGPAAGDADASGLKHKNLLYRSSCQPKPELSLGHPANYNRKLEPTEKMAKQDKRAVIQLGLNKGSAYCTADRTASDIRDSRFKSQHPRKNSFKHHLQNLLS